MANSDLVPMHLGGDYRIIGFDDLKDEVVRDNSLRSTSRMFNSAAYVGKSIYMKGSFSFSR